MINRREKKRRERNNQSETDPHTTYICVYIYVEEKEKTKWCDHTYRGFIQLMTKRNSPNHHYLTISMNLEKNDLSLFVNENKIIYSISCFLPELFHKVVRRPFRLNNQRHRRNLDISTSIRLSGKRVRTIEW